MRLGVWTAFVVLVGCGGDEEDHEEGPICSELSEACHEAGESGDAEAEACHDIAHEAVEADCDAELDRCKTLCDEVLAGLE
jgi:hypothetical protein